MFVIIHHNEVMIQQCMKRRTIANNDDIVANCNSNCFCLNSNVMMTRIKKAAAANLLNIAINDIFF